MSTVICHAKLGDNTSPSTKRPAWHWPWDGTTKLEEPVLQDFKALVFPWSSADGSSLGARPPTKICTRHQVQSRKGHLFYKKTHCQRPLTNCSCWSSQLRAFLSPAVTAGSALNVRAATRAQPRFVLHYKLQSSPTDLERQLCSSLHCFPRVLMPIKFLPIQLLYPGSSLHKIVPRAPKPNK